MSSTTRFRLFVEFKIAELGIRILIYLNIAGDTNPYKNVCLSKTSMVHPDDVVRAHIYLFEHPQAKGRFICSSDVITVEETAELLSLKLPELPLPSSR